MLVMNNLRVFPLVLDTMRAMNGQDLVLGSANLMKLFRVGNKLSVRSLLDLGCRLQVFLWKMALNRVFMMRNDEFMPGLVVSSYICI